jgi:hypothetical protein
MTIDFFSAVQPREVAFPDSLDGFEKLRFFVLRKFAVGGSREDFVNDSIVVFVV